MNYQLPWYPTNRLEVLLHMDVLARAMMEQQPPEHQGHTLWWGIVPIWPIMHVGSMVMMIIFMLVRSSDSSRYTLVYDPAMLDDNHTSISLDAKSRLITSFGHKISVHTTLTQIPDLINDICCMLQLYTPLEHIHLYTIDQHESIIDQYPILWIGANLHHGLTLNTSLEQDEIILTQLTLGQANDDTIIGHALLSTMIHHYDVKSTDHSVIPISYHNTALVDGQKDSTTSYCAAVII